MSHYPPMGFNFPNENNAESGYPTEGNCQIPDMTGFPNYGQGMPPQANFPGAQQTQDYGASPTFGFNLPQMPSYQTQLAQNYGVPSTHGYGVQPLPNYAAPNSQNFGAPPVQSYGGPPSHSYGVPPTQFGGVPPSQGYVVPPQHGYHAPQTHGYGVQQTSTYQNASSSIDSSLNVAPTCEPTLKPEVNFDPANDAELLRKAMKGFGTDSKSIIAILSKRTSIQRQQISNKYKACFGKNLAVQLKSELSGDFENLVLTSLHEIPTLNAIACHKAIEGLGTDEITLIQVIVPATNEEIEKIKTAYMTAFNKSLEKDVIGDTSGDFQKILVSMLQGSRDEGTQVNQNQAQADAEALFNAGEGKIGTEESTFTRILTQRSFAQIKAIAACYLQRYQKTLIKAIENETSGFYEKTMVAIVRFAEDRNGLFARWFYESMKGLGTKDDMLIRLVLTRAEVDLGDIKVAYSRDYKKSLGKAIEGDTSGNYKRMLLAIVDGEKPK